MGERYTKTILLNMCMVYNEADGTVLVQDKLPKGPNGWGGITFPGGHVEAGESMLASVIREVREETGLTVENVRQCGLIDWFCEDDYSRLLIFLYKTHCFSGTLLNETHESKVFWLPTDQLPFQKLAPDFKTYLTLFFGDTGEAFGKYGSEYNGKLNLCEI